MVAEYRPIGQPWTSKQEQVRNVTSAALAWLLQRLPFLSHLGLLVLCAIGPIFAPQLLAFFLVFTHVVFVCCQTRTAYGIIACWRGTKAHAETDWMEHYTTEKVRLEASGRAHHVLAVTDVQHVIIVPAYKEDNSTLREVRQMIVAASSFAPAC